MISVIISATRNYRVLLPIESSPRRNECLFSDDRVRRSGVVRQTGVGVAVFPLYEMSDGNSSRFDLISSKANRRPEGIQII